MRAALQPERTSSPTLIEDAAWNLRSAATLLGLSIGRRDTDVEVGYYARMADDAEVKLLKLVAQRSTE